METLVDLLGGMIGESHPEPRRTVPWAEDEGQHCLSAAPLGVVQCDQGRTVDVPPGCGQKKSKSSEKSHQHREPYPSDLGCFPPF